MTASLRTARLESRVAELERGRDALIARVDHLDESVATIKEEQLCQTTNNGESQCHASGTGSSRDGYSGSPGRFSPSSGSTSTATTDAASLSLSDAMEALRAARMASYAFGERAARERYEDRVHDAVDAVLAAWDRERPDMENEAWGDTCAKALNDRDAWKARAEKAEASYADAVTRCDRLIADMQTSEAALADSQKQIVRLTGEEAFYRGECEELRKCAARLQAYCTDHKIVGLGTFVDECVTAECDRLRAALAVERKSVDEARKFINADLWNVTMCPEVCWPWMCAVDERRKKEATQ